jgi:hypothetical protein
VRWLGAFETAPAAHSAAVCQVRCDPRVCRAAATRPPKSLGLPVPSKQRVGRCPIESRQAIRTAGRRSRTPFAYSVRLARPAPRIVDDRQWITLATIARARPTFEVHTPHGVGLVGCCKRSVDPADLLPTSARERVRKSSALEHHADATRTRKPSTRTPIQEPCSKLARPPPWMRLTRLHEKGLHRLTRRCRGAGAADAIPPPEPPHRGPLARSAESTRTPSVG